MFSELPKISLPNVASSTLFDPGRVWFFLALFPDRLTAAEIRPNLHDDKAVPYVASSCGWPLMPTVYL